jgi:hypothetical protein
VRTASAAKPTLITRRLNLLAAVRSMPETR